MKGALCSFGGEIQTLNNTLDDFIAPFKTTEDIKY